jgi:hypothetical protein
VSTPSLLLGVQFVQRPPLREKARPVPQLFCFVASRTAAVIATSPSATYRTTDASIALVITSVSGLAKAGPVNGARAPELTHLKHQPLHEGKST